MERVNDINIQWIDFDANQALKSIDVILTCIQSHYDILRVNTVSFYSENQWEILRKLNPELSQEILQLTDEEVALFPVGGDHELFNPSDFPALYDFSTSIPQKRIEHLGCIRQNIFGDEDGKCNFDMSQSGKVLLKNFMSPKKTHEVLNMACFVNGMCQKHDIQQVVDIGSGKGYLSYFLSKYYHLNVIGVDASYINTAGASKRNFMMDKQWRGLLKSAIKRDGAHGNDSELNSRISRNKEDKETGLKVKNSFQPITAYVNQTTDFSQFFEEEKPICLVGLHACGDLSSSMLRIFTSSDHMKILCNVSCCYHLLTEEFPELSAENREELRDLSNAVNGEDNISSRTEKMHMEDVNKRTNSDSESSLAMSSLENPNKMDSIIVEDSELNARVFKPQLEHLHQAHEGLSDKACSRERQLSTQQNDTQCNNDDSEQTLSHEHQRSQHLDPNTLCGFPMSSYLKGKRPQLNKNARMVGCMAVQRVQQAKELPTEKLFYRAVFQSILVDNFKNLNNSRNVGKLAGKCKNFVEYCRRAFQKLDLDGSMLTDCQLLGYYNKYNPDKRKLQAFNQFRSALAPSIEGLILLDRLLYLKEQKNMKLAYIVKLFDQVISPRCYAIVAVKE